jgi:hypothetical protein
MAKARASTPSLPGSPRSRMRCSGWSIAQQRARVQKRFWRHWLPLAEAFRQYHCGRCALLVVVCRECDHGQIYCAGECSRIRRKESVLRARARYEGSLKGKRAHARRQRKWVQGKGAKKSAQKVTDQGLPESGMTPQSAPIGTPPHAGKGAGEETHDDAVAHDAHHRSSGHQAFGGALNVIHSGQDHGSTWSHD